MLYPEAAFSLSRSLSTWRCSRVQCRVLSSRPRMADNGRLVQAVFASAALAQRSASPARCSPRSASVALFFGGVDERCSP